MQGLRIGVTAARRGQTLVTALERRGATVLWGPTLAGDRPDAEAAAGAVHTLLSRRPAWVVASTGVAVRTLLDGAQRSDQAAALAGLLAATRVVARGAKAHGALRALGAEPVFVSPQETDEDTASWLAGRILPGETVALLLHGGGGAAAYQPVAAAGATLLALQPYRSAAPADTAPAQRLIDAACVGDLDAVTCTSPGSFRNLVAIAEDAGQRDELLQVLRQRVAVAVVGPVTARAVEEAGGCVNVMPLRQRSADLVHALEAWSTRGAQVVSGPLRLLADGRAVGLPEGGVTLGRREFELLAGLVRRPDVVVATDVLAVEVWGSAARRDTAAVRHHVSPVRRKLGRWGSTIRTVRSHGYRYEPTT